MAFDVQLADRVRAYLTSRRLTDVQEKKMFGGLAFMINDKMCINVSGEKLMCRFDPVRINEVACRKGYMPMVMRDRHYMGYCYVERGGFSSEKDFAYWMNLCLDFNKQVRDTKSRPAR